MRKNVYIKEKQKRKFNLQKWNQNYLTSDFKMYIFPLELLRGHDQRHDVLNQINIEE